MNLWVKKEKELREKQLGAKVEFVQKIMGQK